MSEQFPDSLTDSSLVKIPGNVECSDEKMARLDALSSQRPLTLDELGDEGMNGLIERGRVEEAVAALEPYVTGKDIRAASVAAHWLANFVYCKGAPMANAEKWLEARQLSLISDNPEIQQMAADELADFYYCKGDLDAAASWFERMAGGDGKPGEVSLNLANIDNNCTYEMALAIAQYLRKTKQHERASDWFAFVVQEFMIDVIEKTRPIFEKEIRRLPVH